MRADGAHLGKRDWDPELMDRGVKNRARCGLTKIGSQGVVI